MKKAILVPSDIAQNVKPLDETLGNLDSEMMRIIHTQDIPMDVKLRKYNQVLQRFRTMQTERNRPYEIEIKDYNTHKVDIESILRGIPEKKIPQAKLLTDFITKQHPIQIEENGEITLNGTQIYNSNIVDIVHDLIRDRKTNLPPTGIENLARVLKQANMPLEYIGNKNRINLFHQHNPAPFRRPQNWEE